MKSFFFSFLFLLLFFFSIDFLFFLSSLAEWPWLPGEGGWEEQTDVACVS